MNESEDDLENMLPAAGKTVPYDMPRLDQLFLRLRLLAELLQDFPQPFTEPSLVVRRRDGKVVASPVGRGLRIGRAEGCELAFPDLLEVSRVHFAIAREGDGHVLVDSDSANGTYLNGSRERTARHQLHNGDIIEAGGLIFAFLQA